jgi:predicted nucleic acid-binding protein
MRRLKSYARVPRKSLKNLQIGTIDALLAQLCIRHHLTLLTTDQDFSHATRHCRLRIWRT